MYKALDARNGVPFEPCYKQFYRVIRLANITLPVGQMTHVLRHTFASHFMMGGGNIVVLQRILGYSRHHALRPLRPGPLGRRHLPQPISPIFEWRQSGGIG